MIVNEARDEKSAEKGLVPQPLGMAQWCLYVVTQFAAMVEAELRF
jgi:hypothetical protein